MKHYLLLQTQKPQAHRHKKNTLTLPILIYCTISQLFIDKYKAIFLVCFIDLPEYRKILKNLLLLDWCYNANLSTQIKHPGVDGGENVAALAKFQSAWGAFHHLTLMDSCQKF